MVGRGDVVGTSAVPRRGRRGCGSLAMGRASASPVYVDLAKTSGRLRPFELFIRRQFEDFKTRCTESSAPQGMRRYGTRGNTRQPDTAANHLKTPSAIQHDPVLAGVKAPRCARPLRALALTPTPRRTWLLLPPPAHFGRTRQTYVSEKCLGMTDSCLKSGILQSRPFCDVAARFDQRENLKKEHAGTEVGGHDAQVVWLCSACRCDRLPF